MRPVTAVMFVACLGADFTGAAADDALERLIDIADEGFSPVDRELDRPPFYHAKSLTVTRDSLDSGWVRNHQCHRHFSATPSLEIVFPAGKIRNIAITDSSNLGNVEVLTHTIRLEEVNEQTALCFDSENRVLQRESEHIYQITAGPFYYRFLDGYFPLEVKLEIRYPPSLLELLRINPDNRRGVEVSRSDGEIRLWSRFEGTLWVHVFLRRR